MLDGSGAKPEPFRAPRQDEIAGCNFLGQRGLAT